MLPPGDARAGNRTFSLTKERLRLGENPAAKVLWDVPIRRNKTFLWPGGEFLTETLIYHGGGIGDASSESWGRCWKPTRERRKKRKETREKITPLAWKISAREFGGGPSRHLNYMRRTTRRGRAGRAHQKVVTFLESGVQFEKEKNVINTTRVENIEENELRRVEFHSTRLFIHDDGGDAKNQEKDKGGRIRGESQPRQARPQKESNVTF